MSVLTLSVDPQAGTNGQIYACGKKTSAVQIVIAESPRKMFQKSKTYENLDKGVYQCLLCLAS